MTWRVQTIEHPEMQKALIDHKSISLAHWHGDELALFQYIGTYRIATIASTSKDGSIMNTMLHLQGGKTSRGSSTRGGVQALKGLIRIVRSGRNCSFAVDGPKGPIYKVKPGVFELSRILDCPIFPAGVACEKAFRFNKSWNQTYLPKPFAKMTVVWDKPMTIESKDADPRDPKLALELEDRLDAAKQQAYKYFSAN